MDRIDTYDVVETKRLIVPDGMGEDVWFRFLNGDETIQLRLIIKNDESSQDSVIKVIGRNDHAEIDLVNWNGELGTSTLKPVKIGTSENNRQIFVMIALWRINTVTIVDAQLMLGD
jgi:hypothetical protein